MRYALYFSPTPDDPLTVAASRWLGRDAFGRTVEQTQIGGLSQSELAALTASPRRYGFHATLKAPFRLKEESAESDLLRGVEAVCQMCEPFELPRLKLARLGSFFALVPDGRVVQLNDFAGYIVRAFDRFRAPLTGEERLRRHPERLTPAQRAYLEEWGYPYVFDEFRFHMTLTGPVEDADADRIESHLVEVFASHLDRPVSVDALSVFAESDPGADFRVLLQCPFSAGAKERLGR